MADPTETTSSGTDSPAPAPPAGPADDWATRYKYLLADFDNYRKRTDRERDSAQARIRGAMLRSLLPIYEAFERARDNAATASGAEALSRGLDLLEAEWQKLLKEEGVEAVAHVGQPFAPDEQEAVAESPATGSLPDGVVAEVVQQGYRFRGGLLRPAKVVVARGPTPAALGEPPVETEPSASGEPP